MTRPWDAERYKKAAQVEPKKKTFLVGIREVHVSTREVEAETKEEAIEKAGHDSIPVVLEQ